MFPTYVYYMFICWELIIDDQPLVRTDLSAAETRCVLTEREKIPDAGITY